MIEELGIMSIILLIGLVLLILFIAIIIVGMVL